MADRPAENAATPQQQPSIMDRMRAFREREKEDLAAEPQAPDAEDATPSDEAQAPAGRDEKGRFVKQANEPEEAPQARAEDADEQPDDGGGSPQAEPEEAREITSMPELLDYLRDEHGIEISAEDFYNLNIPITGPDSKSAMVALGKAKDAYQLNARLEKAQADLQAQREAFERERNTQLEQAQARAMEAAALAEAAEKQLKAEMDGIDWSELYNEDPARYAAEKARAQDRQAQIDRAKQGVREQFAKFQQEQAEKQREHAEHLLAREREALLTALPDWRDQEKAKAEMSELRSYLQDVGYQDREIDSAVDHRAILLARKAMLFDRNAKQASDVVAKKVVRVGKKPLKPGSRPSKQETKRQRIEPLRKKLRKSGDWRDAVSLLREQRK